MKPHAVLKESRIKEYEEGGEKWVGVRERRKRRWKVRCTLTCERSGMSP